MTLAVVGGVVVFLMGCCLLVLAVIALRLERLLKVVEASARRRAAQDKKRRPAVASLVRELRAVRRAVVGELRQQARERRATVAQLVEQQWTPLEPSASSAPPTSRPRALVKPGVFSLPPDAPTPPSGYPVSALWSGPDGGAS